MKIFESERFARLRQKQETTFVPIFLHRPLAILFLLPTADWSFLTPNRLTTISVLMRFVAAYLLLPEQFYGPAPSTSVLVWAIVLWHLGCVLDAADGTLARYRGAGTALGRY